MKKTVEVYDVNKITAGGFHCWCSSNVGVIRKPNYAVASELLSKFFPKKSAAGSKLRWWQRLWNWLKSLLNKGRREKQGATMSFKAR